MVSPLRAEAGDRRVLLTILLTLPVLALLIYLALGAEGAPDQPLAERLEAPLDELPIGAIILKIEQRLHDNPGDTEGWRLLARLRQQAGFFDRAITAWQMVEALDGAGVDISLAIAQNYIALDGGLITQPALDEFSKAAQLMPDHPQLLYYQALAARQMGDFSSARMIWNTLIQSLREEDPLKTLARQQIEVMDQQAEKEN